MFIIIFFTSKKMNRSDMYRKDNVLIPSLIGTQSKYKILNSSILILSRCNAKLLFKALGEISGR